MGESLLSRVPSSPCLYSGTSPLQNQVDQLVGGFIQQATDWRSLAAMTAGGMAYRMGRIGVMGLGGGNLMRAVSVGAGLTAEVSAFEMAHRGLTSLSVPPDQQNLWRWSGPGGLRQGLAQSFITFGALKGTSRLAQGQNLIAQHLFQDTAMVLGHQASGAFGLGPRPTGSMAEQFLHAEATNLQIGAGMALAHRFAPGITVLERGLDLMTPSPLTLSLEGEGGRRSGEGGLTRRLQPALAAAGKGPPIFLMATSQEPGDGKLFPEAPPNLPTQPIRDRIQQSAPFQPNEIGALLTEISNNNAIPVSERYELLMEAAFHPSFKDFNSLLKALEKLSRNGAGSADLEALLEIAARTGQAPPAEEKKPTFKESFRRRPLYYTVVSYLLQAKEPPPNSAKPLQESPFSEFSSTEKANAALLALSIGALAAHPEFNDPQHFHKALDMLRRSGADPFSIGFALREFVKSPHLSDDTSFAKILKILPLTLVENRAFSIHTQEVLDRLLEHPHFNAGEQLENYLAAIQEITDSPNFRVSYYPLISKHPRFKESESYVILLSSIFQEKANRDVALKAAAAAFEQKTFLEFSLALDIIQKQRAKSETKISALAALANNPNVGGEYLLKIVEDIRDESKSPLKLRVNTLRQILENRWIYDHAVLEEMAEEFLSFLVRPRKTLPNPTEIDEDLKVVSEPLERIAANLALPPSSFEQIKNIISQLTYMTTIDRMSLILKLQSVFDKKRQYSN